MVLGLTVGTGIGLAMARDMDWGSLSSAFGDFPVRWALISLAVFSAATAMRAYRWQVLFIGAKVPIHRLLLVQNVGIGLNSVSPLRIISEATQFLMLTVRYRVRGEEVAATLGTTGLGFRDRGHIVDRWTDGSAQPQGVHTLCHRRGVDRRLERAGGARGHLARIQTRPHPFAVVGVDVSVPQRVVPGASEAHLVILIDHGILDIVGTLRLGLGPRNGDRYIALGSHFAGYRYSYICGPGPVTASLGGDL